MSTSMEGPSIASDIALPVEVVTLKHLRTRDGLPVRVRCEGVDELAITEVMQRLPGGVVPSVNADAPVDPAEAVRTLDAYGCPLIERATALVGADGSEVRPAFYFDSSTPHDPRSLPGRFLRVEDRTALVTCILKLCGYVGEDSLDGAGFHGADGGGAGDGMGAVEAGASHRTDPVGGAA